MRSAVLAAAALILMPEVSPFAQSEAGDWEIGELDLSGLKWGKQTRRIPIRNNTDDYHFLVAHCVTQSARQGYARPRETVSNYVVLPGEQGLVHIVIDVPESFAEVTVTFGIYDVVDTLDDLALGSKLYGREERVKVIFPESLEAIRESNLRAGWILRYNESLSDDLQLALNLMLARGEPISKIAESTGLPTEYVIHLVRLLSENGLARITDTAISSALVAVEDLPFRRIDALISASARDMQAALIQASAIYHSEHKR
ncbi:MAG: hypothetical protein ACE5GA_06890, partial [Candidatus Zixiibacteriota bacterium]